LSTLSGEEVVVLTRRAREVLKSGRHIVVLGLNGHCCSQEIKKLSGKQILLYDSTPPTGIGPKVGLVLHTRYVDHRDTDRIEDSVVYKPPVGVGLIKQILESCADLILSSPKPVANERSHPATAEPVAQAPLVDAADRMSFDALDLLTTPTRRHEMDNMDRFTEAFLEAAGKDGFVGKITLGRLLKEHGIKGEPRRLIKNGWLVGVVRDGCKKFGSYKAGEKMLSSVKQEKFEPEDLSDRVKFLIAQKPELLAEKAGLEDELKRVTSEFEAKIAEVNQKLARTETAEKLLEELKAL
jgi:hypothetical protein